MWRKCNDVYPSLFLSSCFTLEPCEVIWMGNNKLNVKVKITLLWRFQHQKHHIFWCGCYVPFYLFLSFSLSYAPKWDLRFLKYTIFGNFLENKYWVTRCRERGAQQNLIIFIIFYSTKSPHSARFICLKNYILCS